MSPTLDALIDLNRSLNEVRRLHGQRRTLAKYLLEKQQSLRISRRIADVLRQQLDDHQVAILRVAEERDHLRAELESEKSAAREALQTLQADLDAVRAEANDLDTKWRAALEAQCQAIVDRDEARGRAAMSDRRAIAAEAKYEQLRPALQNLERELHFADKAMSMVNQELRLSLPLWALIQFRHWARSLWIWRRPSQIATQGAIDG